MPERSNVTGSASGGTHADAALGEVIRQLNLVNEALHSLLQKLDADAVGGADYEAEIGLDDGDGGINIR